MKLPIIDTVFEAFHFVWGNRIDLARMIAAPVFALAILQLVLATLVPIQTPDDAKAITGMQKVVLFLGVLFSIAFYSMFAVAWHRRCLRPEEQTTIWTALKWDRRKSLFLIRFILISILSALGTLPVVVILSIVVFVLAAGGASLSGGTADPSSAGGLANFLSVILVGLVFCITMLIGARLSLLLPATALDQKLTWTETWVLGRGNTMQLFAIFLMAVAPASLLVIFLQIVARAISVGTGLGGTLTFIFIAQLVLNFAYYIGVATSVSALSISYRKLRQTPSPGMPYQM
jgi:hypothetical protein